jgi:hypothetical protein
MYAVFLYMYQVIPGRQQSFVFILFVTRIKLCN